MSRFPTVAGRAPRRQEEGERPRDPQEERPSAVSIADRGAILGTLPWPARVTAGAFGGHKSLPGAGREERAGGRSLLLALRARSELCVQWEHLGLEGGGPRPKLSENPLGAKKVNPEAQTRSPVNQAHKAFVLYPSTPAPLLLRLRRVASLPLGTV